MKNKKVLVGGIIILVTVGILYWLGIIGFWTDNLKNYWEERQDQKYFQELENKSAELERLYKEDTFGGDTPEETLELFIAALKKEDIDLASKYYIVEKQKDALEKLPQSFQSGGAKSLIDYYENGEIKSIPFKDDSRYSIRILKEENEAGFRFQLILNKETNKWKILEL